MKFLLGMGQILVEGGEPQKNLGRATAAIREAAAKGCKIVVLPECLDVGWTHPSAWDLAQPIPGPSSELLCAAAREAGIYAVAGLTERAGAKIYNSAVLISPEGEILALHRKINELCIAHELYSIGDRLSVVETPLGVLAMNICADNFRNCLVLAHSLARMGAQLLLSPSAWAVEAEHKEEDGYGKGWSDSYGTLGQMYGLTTVGVSNVGPIAGGPWQGKKCIGCSVAVGPDGQILARGPYGEDAEALVVVEVDPAAPQAKGTNISPMLEKKGYPTKAISCYVDSAAALSK